MKMTAGGRWARAVAAVWLAASFEAGGQTSGEVPPVAVVSSGRIPAYREALEGFRAEWGGRPGEVAWFEIEEGSPAGLLRRLRLAKPRVVVAMGTRALDLAAELEFPLVSTMVLSGEVDAAVPPKAVARILLDVPPPVALARIRLLFPGRRRVGVIWNPTQAGLGRAELQGYAAEAGLWLHFLDCVSPRALVEAIPEFHRKVDLVWCLPDRRLYPPPSVSALILAAIRDRLPLVGFSESFVRAGALVGFYPDYHQIGAQAAEAVRRFEEGRPTPPLEPPRAIRTAVNERVLRALGIQLRLPKEAGEVVFLR